MLDNRTYRPPTASYRFRTVTSPGWIRRICYAAAEALGVRGGGNQKQLGDQIAKEMNLSIRQGRAIVSRLLELIQLDLVEKGRCELRGLGTFAVFERPARETTHPVTGQPVLISARRGVRYRSSRKLKELLNAEKPKKLKKGKKRPSGVSKPR